MMQGGNQASIPVRERRKKENLGQKKAQHQDESEIQAAPSKKKGDKGRFGPGSGSPKFTHLVKKSRETESNA